MTSSAPTEASVVIHHQVGLHARPSVKLTKLAKTFESAIHVRSATALDWVDAKSIVRVMGLKIPKGETLIFKADGPDATAAVDALVGLVKRDFDEQTGA